MKRAADKSDELCLSVCLNSRVLSVYCVWTNCFQIQKPLNFRSLAINDERKLKVCVARDPGHPGCYYLKFITNLIMKTGYCLI